MNHVIGVTQPPALQEHHDDVGQMSQPTNVSSSLTSVYSTHTCNWEAIKHFFSFPLLIMPECDNSHIMPKRLKLTGLFLRLHRSTADYGRECKGNETDPNTIFHKVTPYCIFSFLVLSRDE